MKLGIVLPLYLSSDVLLDFTKETIKSIKSDEHEIYLFLINNFSLPELYPLEKDFNLHSSIKSFEVIDNPKGNHVPCSWNLGIKTGIERGMDYVAVLNNDLVLHPRCIDNLIKFANNHSEFILWSASEWLDKKTLLDASLDEVVSEHPHFSFFMVNQKTMDSVGWFDENLKMAYFEDFLYHYQILVLGQKAGKTETAKFYHYGSRTIKVDENLYDKNKRNYEDNRTYVVSKCGVDTHDKVFDPPEEVLTIGYKYPFNDSSKSWKI